MTAARRRPTPVAAPAATAQAARATPALLAVAGTGHTAAKPAEAPAAARPSSEHLIDQARRAVRAAQRRDRIQRALAPLVTLVVLAVLWERWAASADSITVAGFFDTAERIPEVLTDPEFWSALGRSAQSGALGFLSATVTGVPLGVLIARRPRVDRVVDVYVSIVLTTPIAAIMPLLLMITGLGTTTLVIIVFLFAWPFVVVNTRTGVRGVDRGLIDMARSFGASEREIWTKVLIPAAAPAIFVGLRLGLSRAINGVFVAELVIIAVGVGGLLLEYRAGFRGADLFATVIVVILISLLLLNVLKLVQRRLFPWSDARIGAPR